MRNRIMISAPARVRDASRPDAAEGEHCLPFGDAQFRELEWRQPRRFRTHYELRSERGLHLLLGNADLWGRTWRARGEQLEWELRSRWLGGVVVTVRDSEATLLEFRPGWWIGGRVETAAGEALRWRLAGLKHFELTTEEGSPLLTLRRVGWFRFAAAVELSEAARSRADVAPLNALALRLMLAARRQTH